MSSVIQQVMVQTIKAEIATYERQCLELEELSSSTSAKDQIDALKEQVAIRSRILALLDEVEELEGTPTEAAVS